MSAVMRFFGAWSCLLCLNPGEARRLAANTTADSAKRLREPPIILAEVIAASSFLDFGGIPDARYFDTLYDWRHSEAGKNSQIAPPKKGTFTLATCSRCSKRIFRGSLRREWTFRDREPVSKMLSKFAKWVRSTSRADTPCYCSLVE
jgi:hypothetical protein